MALLQRRLNLNLHIQLPEETDDHEASQLSTDLALIDRLPKTQHTLDDFEKLEILGYGNGGTVYKVRNNHTGVFYALKLIRSSKLDQVYKETEIHSSTNSPFVVSIHDVFTNSSGEVALLMEYMDGGSIDCLAKTDGKFSEAILSNIAKQVLMGLDYLHKSNIVHYDIKPANLLVNCEMQVKISDFGISKKIGNDKSHIIHEGTYAYMSPGRFDPETYGYDGFAEDIWSLGITLMELYLGHNPYVQLGENVDGNALMWEICFGDPPSLPEEASDAFRDFIQRCLQKDWKDRLSASLLLSHPFIVGKR